MGDIICIIMRIPHSGILMCGYVCSRFYATRPEYAIIYLVTVMYTRHVHIVDIVSIEIPYNVSTLRASVIVRASHHNSWPLDLNIP